MNERIALVREGDPTWDHRRSTGEGCEPSTAGVRLAYILLLVAVRVACPVVVARQRRVIAVRADDDGGAERLTSVLCGGGAPAARQPSGK